MVDFKEAFAAGMALNAAKKQRKVLERTAKAQEREAAARERTAKAQERETAARERIAKAQEREADEIEKTETLRRKLLLKELELLEERQKK